MALRLPLSGNKHVIIISGYATTMTNPDELKDKFYDELDSIIFVTPGTDKLILLGDLNARFGTDHQTREGVIGSEGVCKCNSNGLLLLKKWAEHDLLITNTVLKQDILDASSIQTMASHRLPVCHCAENR